MESGNEPEAVMFETGIAGRSVFAEHRSAGDGDH